MRTFSDSGIISHRLTTYTNTNLTVLGADGLWETLNGSLLTLSSLADWTQLTLHLVQLLLQLLQTEKGHCYLLWIHQAYFIIMRHILTRHTMLLASLSWILACRDWTWSWAFCSSLTHCPAAHSYWLSWLCCSSTRLWNEQEGMWVFQLIKTTHLLISLLNKSSSWIICVQDYLFVVRKTEGLCTMCTTFTNSDHSCVYWCKKPCRGESF